MVMPNRIFLLFVLTLLALITPFNVSASTLHGTVYDWSTFEPLENTIVEINSTPVQSMVAVDGYYNFSLPHGSYQITVRHYNNGILEHTLIENVSMETEGSFVLDLLMLPTTEFEEMFIDDIDISEPIVIPEKSSQQSLVLIIAAIVMILIFAVLLWKKVFTEKVSPVPSKEPQAPAYEEDRRTLSIESIPAALPDDLLNIVNIISKNGGRMTQKELRKHLSTSEAKTSLMISDLEDRGIINKIKKGRGNILILNR